MRRSAVHIKAASRRQTSVILEFLLRNAGSRTAIIEAVWGFDEEVELNTADVYIKILREKLDNDPHRKLIQTVRGYGYVIRA